MLLGIDYHLHTAKQESNNLLSNGARNLNIEHLLPQSWEKNWPLDAAPGEDDYEEVLQRRIESVHQLGNLTITTTKLNPSLSNKAWQDKRTDIQKHSLLRLTTASVPTAPDSVSNIGDQEWSAAWNEERIRIRGEWMRDQALAVWSRPETSIDTDVEDSTHLIEQQP